MRPSHGPLQRATRFYSDPCELPLLAYVFRCQKKPSKMNSQFEFTCRPKRVEAPFLRIAHQSLLTHIPCIDHLFCLRRKNSKEKRSNRSKSHASTRERIAQIGGRPTRNRHRIEYDRDHAVRWARQSWWWLLEAWTRTDWSNSVDRR